MNMKSNDHIKMLSNFSGSRTQFALALLASLALAGCGGGGGGESGGGSTPPAAAPEPTVSALLTSSAKYGQSLLVTVAGTNLDQPLTVTSSGCKGIVRSTTAPNVSSSTTAYFQCAVSALGASQVVVANARGETLASGAFTVLEPQVTMTVSNGAGVEGVLLMTLAPDKTPVTVDNFLRYVNAGFYDGTIFHRVVPGFVVQGGGYLPISPGAAPVAKPTNAPIALEVNRGLSNRQWTLAMARTSASDSATSQFFVNLQDNSATLDPGPAGAGYAVFGSLSADTSVVTAIASAPCQPIAGFSECAPDPSLRITSATQTQ